MIDTVVIESPSVTPDVVEFVEQFCIKNQGVNLRSGEIMYSFTRGSLEGSFDSRISLQVKTQKWSTDFRESIRHAKHVPVLVDCPPYLRVECSIHKTMAGHNIFGGPDDFQGAVKWLVWFLNGILCIELPDALEWSLSRVDFAEVYDLGDYVAVEEWFRGMKNSTFPRRQPSTYGLTGLYFPGATTTVKFYHKGPEFAKHDRKRVSKFLPLPMLNDLQLYANKLLRVEVEVHSRKLKGDFGERSPLIKEVSTEYLQKIYEKEVSKLIRESAGEAKVYRTAQAVEQRLYSMFSTELSGALLGTWYRLATLGEELVKKSMPKPTYYRHRKFLVQAGVSWQHTDVILKEFSCIPSGFVPLLADSRRVVNMDSKVAEMLLKVA